MYLAQNIELVRNLIEEDRRITVNQIANELGISFGSTFSILTEDLGFSKLSARWVPKALQQNQMNLRSDLSLALLTRIEANESNFFERVITGDETWIYQYDPESKVQSKQWLPEDRQALSSSKQKGQLKKSWQLFFGIKMESFC